MLFSSLAFLFVFLPLILVFYYLSPKKYRNYILLLFSILFYAWGGVSYTLILIASILTNYFLVKAINKSAIHKQKWLVGGLVFNTLVIVVFKYLDFFIENLNFTAHVFSDSYTDMPLQNIILPLGISFFTFQQMSLLWDVYRNPNSQKETFTNTALYISFFPQLIAGPIVRYNDIIEQIKNRKETMDLFRSGVERFILGLFKKIVFANTCAAIADSIMNNPADELSTSIAWLGILAYTFQIYFDFSGYSDMAIGLGKMFGFRILENFNFPYIARSIKEFWRRWHISLSSWFRDYVYIPLGGGRLGSSRTYVNLMIVFLLTGFWHGATWSFVFWGVFHGLFLIIERLGFDKLLYKVPKVISWSYTMLIVMIGWVFFRVEELNEAFSYVGKLFGFGTSVNHSFIEYMDGERWLILILAVLASTTFFDRIRIATKKLKKSKWHSTYMVCKDVTFVFMFLYAVMIINSGSYNPFIYFRF